MRELTLTFRLLRLAVLLLRPLAALLALPQLACSGPPAASSPALQALQQSAADSLTTGTRCQAVRLSTEPDLFGWDSGSRGKLVSVASQGLAVVSYEQVGCDVRLSVLGNCLTHKSRYEYRAYSESQRKVARDEVELYAGFPLAAAELRGQLRQGRGIRADYRLAGVERVAVGTSFHPRDLEGQCEGATHVVTAIYRGVFSIGAGADTALVADGSLLGGERTRSLEVLDHAGDPNTCSLGTQLASGCDVPLRLELTQLVEGRQAGNTLVDTVDSLPSAETPEPAHACPQRMSALPSGSFYMGADTTWQEQPVHKVNVTQFCMDQREVTVAEYEHCVRSGVCGAIVAIPNTRNAKQCLPPSPDNGPLPRNCVSWGQSKLYCEYKDKRLPTEAEFEYAARGGSKNFLYPWGNADLTSERACFGRKEGPCPVASFPSGAFGLWDMAGNLDEWVWDWFGRYSAQAQTDPTGPTTGSRRVLKGGSYSSEVPRQLRGSARLEEMTRGSWSGFRCARDR